jgi:hypothetical protein
MTEEVGKKSGDKLSGIIKQALDAGFTSLAYWLLTLAAIIPMLIATSGHDGDEILSYFRYFLLILAISAVSSIILGAPRLMKTIDASERDSISKIGPPPA